MPGCVVKWCRSHTRLNKCPGITFHYFPYNSIRRNKWIAAVRLERQENDWMPVKTSRVCSVHFDDKDFYKSPKGYTMLHKIAVPICTMIRPEKTSNSIAATSLEDTIENVKNSHKERSQLANESKLRDKTSTVELQAHKVQKRKLVNNTNTNCNEAIEEEPIKTKIKNDPDSTEIYIFEEGSVTPINISSSDIESTLNTPKTHILEQKLRKKTLLAAQRLSQIRNLERRNKRLVMKINSLKDALSQLKKKTAYRGPK